MICLISQLSEVLEKSGATEEQCNNVLECVDTQVSIVYKRKPCEVNIGPFNTII